MNDTYDQLTRMSDVVVRLAQVTDLRDWSDKPTYAFALRHLRKLYANKKDEICTFELYEVKNFLATLKRCEASYRTQQCCNRMINIIDNIVQRLKLCGCDALCRKCDATHEGRRLDKLQRRYIAGP